MRIVAATNRNLEEEMSAGRFREDLYYRLKVFPIRVPPLRERRDDIPLLANHFLERFTKEIGRAVAGFAQQTMDLLMAYDWPGNVRELSNVIERAVVLAEGDAIQPDLLLYHRARRQRPRAPRVGLPTLAQMEREHIEEALRRSGDTSFSYEGSFLITWLRKLIYIEDIGVSLTVIYVLTAIYLATVLISYPIYPVSAMKRLRDFRKKSRNQSL